MRPTKAIIRLEAVRHNLQLARRLAPQARNVAVVKANAYGHGAIEIARALEPGVDAFGVAIIEEALALREAGLTRPILIMQGTTCDEDVSEASARDFWLMLHDREQVEQVLRTPATRPVTAWLKLDTGMHRLGMTLAETARAVAELGASDKVGAPLVLATHLACADEPDHPLTQRQLSEFSEFARPLGLPVSIANSAGIMHWPQSHGDWNRPGIMLYGASPSLHFEEVPGQLQAAMTMQSEVIAIRDVAPGEGAGYGQTWVARVPSRLGTVAIGYGDGYPRHAPSGTPVLVNGQRAPLAGTVSMDLITVDLTELDGVRVGDPVELWGDKLPVNEVAACAGTIGYELLAGLTGRVPLVYC